MITYYSWYVTFRVSSEARSVLSFSMFALTLSLCRRSTSVLPCSPPGEPSDRRTHICTDVYLSWLNTHTHTPDWPTLSLPTVSSCQIMKLHLHFLRRWLLTGQKTKLYTRHVVLYLCILYHIQQQVWFALCYLVVRIWWKMSMVTFLSVWHESITVSVCFLCVFCVFSVSAAQSADQLGGEHGRGGRAGEETLHSVRPLASHQDLQRDARQTDATAENLTTLRWDVQGHGASSQLREQTANVSSKHEHVFAFIGHFDRKLIEG